MCKQTLIQQELTKRDNVPALSRFFMSALGGQDE